MTTIRCYERGDSERAGKLIASTYREFNLAWVPADELGLFLGPFRHAGSNDKSHQEAIAQTIDSAIVLVAEVDGELAGILRGRKQRLGSLFVSGSHHRQGIGGKLVERFERECVQRGATVIRVAATLYAVPFYRAMGYKKSTGVRIGWSFEGRGLKIQPMRKVL
jgi:GNAT superfamily N-acetyltransferase